MPLPTLVFATHNAHKVAEVQALLADRYTVKSLTEIGCEEQIVEDALTLEGNARLKAEYVKKHFGFDCFADDTGLEVEALAGAPGVLSARYAGPKCDAADNVAKLLGALASAPRPWEARFRTAICLLRGEEVIEIDGICTGEIVPDPEGEEGFGYDPVFLPHGSARTFAQMSSKDKNATSHRGRAIRAMLPKL